MSKRQIVLLAHNIRSLWNVGSFFRTCDAFKVAHVYLTGYTATPPRIEIHKTALGAEEWIKWSYEKDPQVVIEKLKQEGFQIVALEKTSQSRSITDFRPADKLCLILGHEVLGVNEELQKAADAIVHIDMHGRKESLNVSVAAGIALFELSKST